jgi:LemA protein
LKKILIVAPVLIVLGVGAAVKLNRVHDDLASQRAAIKTQWAQVEAALKGRADLIPGMVEMVQRYTTKETGVFQYVADARAALDRSRTPQEEIQANDQISGAIARLLIIAENYPKLRSNKAFLRLGDEIAGSENRIAVERRKYNEILEHYNAQIQLFPDNIVASVSGFRRNDAYFRTDGANGAVPKLPF